jgi:hypothetical protein
MIMCLIDKFYIYGEKGTKYNINDNNNTIMNKLILTHKQKWRRQRSVNKQYYIEGNIVIIKICKKNVTFSQFDSIFFI